MKPYTSSDTCVAVEGNMTPKLSLQSQRELPMVNFQRGLQHLVLLDSLPLVMMFDLSDNVDIQEYVVQALQEKNMVTISVKPKVRQSNKSVIIKAQERNANGMYVARAELLNLHENLIVVDIPETYKV